jgi:hypothetical protein
VIVRDVDWLTRNLADGDASRGVREARSAAGIWMVKQGPPVPERVMPRAEDHVAA